MNARWLARLALLLVLASAAVLIGFAELAGLVMVVIGAISVAVIVVGAYLFLAHRGLVRWIAIAVVILTPVATLVLFALHNLIWVAAVSVALLLLATGAARRALTRPATDTSMPSREVPPPQRAFLIMNPRSGGGKVAKFGLKEKAEALGAEVALLEGPGVVDVADLARRAIAAGADLLGVAGGDGTQALVAGIAAEHGLPFLVISAGTRNHFAMDLGLDRENPAACLDALTDGVEQRIDLGIIGERTFVNNASFGAYAEIVESPAYRDDKTGTTLQMLPDILSGHRGAKLSARAGGTTVTGPQAVLVSNNPYAATDVAGLGKRDRLDTGTLGVLAVTVGGAADAASLVRGRHSKVVTLFTATEVTVDADTATIPVGVDGEALSMPTPVRCTIRPGALRVRVPRKRPGVKASRPAMNWTQLGHLAVSTGGPAR